MNSKIYSVKFFIIIMKQFTYGQMKKALEKKLTNVKIAGSIDEFHGRKETKTGLWLSGESDTMLGELIAFDYYAQSTLYEFGVLKELRDWLSQRGWHPEWNDAGTIMLYKA